jgi:hypothetical protein
MITLTHHAGDQEGVVCAVLIGNAPTEVAAEQVARNSQGCPYVAMYAATGRMVVGVFALPASKRRWIEIPQERPELLGLQKAAVFVTEGIEASSPWSRGEVRPVLQLAPCGTDCRPCPLYRAGCPATVWAAPAGE